VLVREQEVLAVGLVLGLDDGGCFHFGSLIDDGSCWPQARRRHTRHAFLAVRAA
jgi:hypothetical protein